MLSIAAHADIVDSDWTFSSVGEDLGWKATTGTPPPWLNVQVGDGYWSGDTSDASNFGIISADFIPGDIPLTCSAYVQIKARIRDVAGGTFPQSYGAVYWTRLDQPDFSGNRAVRFRSYGDNQWRVYNVLLGDHPLCGGSLRRIMVAPSTRKNTHIEIAWIRLMRSTTKAVFSVDKDAYPPGAVISNTTPQLKVINYPVEIPSSNTARDPFTPNRAEFYWRPGSSSSDADWVLDGVDDNAFDGLEHTYAAFSDGTYDLGVRVVTNACVSSDWNDGVECWVDNLGIKKDVRPRVNLDAGTSLGAFPSNLLGYNSLWLYWSQIYDPGTKALPSIVQNALDELNVGLLRYPGGCFADTFYWKQTIGPVNLRPPMYTNDCDQLSGVSEVVKFGLDEFLQYCEARNIEPLLTLRFRWPGSPPAPMDPPTSAGAYNAAVEDAVDLVEYCNSPNDGTNPNGGVDWAQIRAANGHPMPYNVRLFEIANEPFGGDPYGGNPPPDTRGAFVTAMTDYVTRMRAVDPSIKVSVYAYLDGQMKLTDPARQNLQFIFQQLPSDLDRTQAHLYLPFSRQQTDLQQLYLETMAASAVADARIKGLRDLLGLTLPNANPGYKLRLSEWNVNFGWDSGVPSGTGNYSKSRTLMAGIAAADIQRVLVENRAFVESSALFPLMDGMGQGVTLGNPMSCFNVTSIYDVVVKNPLYYVMQMFATRLGEALTETRVVGSPTFDFSADSLSMLETTRSISALTAIGGKDSEGGLYLMVINKDMSSSHSAVINLTNAANNPTGAYTAGVWELSSASPWDYNDVTNTQRVRPKKSTITFVNGSEYSFPAHSVTSFVFTPGIASPVYTSIGSLKKLPDGTHVSIDERVVTAVFADRGVFYVENPDRSSGIKVQWSGDFPSENARVTVAGEIVTASNGERYVNADAVVPSGAATPVKPPFIMGQALLAPRPDTHALLVSAAGRVSAGDSTYFFLENGQTGALRIKVYSKDIPVIGSYVKVTGIRTTESSETGEIQNVLLARRASDIEPL